jgi:hypothetical protein
MAREGLHAALQNQRTVLFKYAKVAKIDLHTPTDRFHIGSILPTETCSFVRLTKELCAEKERFGNIGWVQFLDSEKTAVLLT